MIFIIDLTIREGVIYFLPEANTVICAEIQNFSEGEPQTSLYASLFQLCPGINSDSDTVRKASEITEFSLLACEHAKSTVHVIN